MKTGLYHFIVLFIVVVWGTTFVSTKILLSYELSPSSIFFYRFTLAYIGIWFFGRERLVSASVKDEFLFMLAGATGGSIYFMAENTALNITLASNVALLVSTAPIITAILTHLLGRKEKIKYYVWLGSLLALVGVALVAFNGKFILKINPLGDMLSLIAALSWAFYTILLKRFENKYTTLFITRKVFFYGLVTLLPLLFSGSLFSNITVFTQPAVIFNLLYLGAVASLLCYFLFNLAVKKLGAVRTSNYIYLIPLVTMLTSVTVIDEKITIIALAGAILILAGVVLAER
jgi:drug/metabolite transporter (DMT)-like permease